jgi:hypothetical protein
MKYLTNHWLVILILSSILISVSFYAIFLIEDADNPAKTSLTTDETVASYTDLDGNQIVLSENVGQILFVNTWASWSPASTQNLESLVSVANMFEENDIKIIAINRAESKSVAKSFLQTINIADSVELVLDPDDNYYNSIDGYAMPETMIYDTDGEVLKHIRGDVQEKELIELLERYIEASR